MRIIILLAVGLFFANTIQAQIGSSISADGSAPNENAILDVQSPSTGAGKGMLIPRVILDQRTNANASVAGGLLDDSGNLRGGAAQGLIVYQTNGAQGLYFNTSQIAAPAWVYLGSSTTNYLPLTGGTMSGALNMGAQIVTNVAHVDFNGNDVSIGRGANGVNSGAAVGYLANGVNFGVAMGRSANGSSSGTAVGREADGYLGGAAVGYSANGVNSGAAVGYAAVGTNFGVALGRLANGNNNGVALGYNASGFSDGVAVGRVAIGSDNGVAIGFSADGNDFGAAVGYVANGVDFGVAMGRSANGARTNVAIGRLADANGGTERIAIGNSVNNLSNNTAWIRGTLHLDGGSSNIYYRTNFAAGAWTAKAFEIDHPLDPENKILRHFCLEGPQVWNVYAGNAQLVNGQAVVQLPDYYSALNLAGSEIYGLTPIGDAFVWVAGKVSDNRFVIAGKQDIEVSWTIKVLRNDPGCLEDLRRRPVEQMKSELETGPGLR